MTEETEGKDTDHKAVAKERSKPTLVTVGKRKVISTGRWNDDLMADWVSENARKRWVQIGELARVSCGGNSIDTKRRVRRNLSALFWTLFGRGIILAIEYGDDYNGASAVKVADFASEQEFQNVNARLDKMKQKRDLSTQRYDKVVEFLRIVTEAKEQKQTPSESMA